MRTPTAGSMLGIGATQGLIVFAALLAALPASAGAGPGWPTFDASNLMQLQEQMKQLQRQYELLRQQHASLTGNYGRGQIGLTDAISAASAIPGTWQEVVALQAKGAYAQAQTNAERQLATLPLAAFRDPKGSTAVQYGRSSDAVRSALAGGDVLYAQVQTHLNNLTQMSYQVDRTANVKDAQDLQNRIATENGMLQTALVKVNALNMNLQANLVNRQNQATAETQKYFQRQNK